MFLIFPFLYSSCLLTDTPPDNTTWQYSGFPLRLARSLHCGGISARVVVENFIDTFLFLALIGDTAKSFLVLFSDSCTSRVLVMKTSVALILWFIAATVIGTCTAASGNGTRVKRSYETEWDKPFNLYCDQSEYFRGYSMESVRVWFSFTNCEVSCCIMKRTNDALRAIFMVRNE